MPSMTFRRSARPLVFVGLHDFCAPPYFSAEFAERIPKAQLVVLDGGHFIFREKAELLHDTVDAFISKHDA